MVLYRAVSAKVVGATSSEGFLVLAYYRATQWKHYEYMLDSWDTSSGW